MSDPIEDDWDEEEVIEREMLLGGDSSEVALLQGHNVVAAQREIVGGQACAPRCAAEIRRSPRDLPSPLQGQAMQVQARCCVPLESEHVRPRRPAAYLWPSPRRRRRHALVRKERRRR